MRILIAEVDAALAEGRAVNPRVFKRPAAQQKPAPEADRRDFRSLSPAEQQDRRQFRAQHHRDATGTKWSMRSRSKSRGRFGMSGD
ncbi:hypothetical protein [Burkholderia cepacia]|uniref:hypothetical protein n=1 Tax=Burkholderia cepacia TaxID=292 RepID=UPI00158B9EFC|nr:hypothetical protein [Burkholderia cepacia]